MMWILYQRKNLIPYRMKTHPCVRCTARFRCSIYSALFLRQHQTDEELGVAIHEKLLMPNRVELGSPSEPQSTGCK